MLGDVPLDLLIDLPTLVATLWKHSSLRPPDHTSNAVQGQRSQQTPHRGFADFFAFPATSPLNNCSVAAQVTYRAHNARMPRIISDNNLRPRDQYRRP
jgi:hypothetical protein